MGKLAQARSTESGKARIAGKVPVSDIPVSDELLARTKQKEQEIRMKLAKFAQELSKAKQQRNHH